MFHSSCSLKCVFLYHLVRNHWQWTEKVEWAFNLIKHRKACNSDFSCYWSLAYLYMWNWSFYFISLSFCWNGMQTAQILWALWKQLGKKKKRHPQAFPLFRRHIRFSRSFPQNCHLRLVIFLYFAGWLIPLYVLKRDMENILTENMKTVLMLAVSTSSPPQTATIGLLYHFLRNFVILIFHKFIKNI